jgi:DNA-binding MarR family transcriptional regulator
MGDTKTRSRASSQSYDPLSLDNQLCFAVYTASRAITRRYAPMLDRLDLTYTQYIAMMVLWECKRVSVKELGARLHLDSGTLTPVVKKLAAKGYVTRKRAEKDERVTLVELTEKGADLRERALSVPAEMGSCVDLEMSEALQLKGLLEKVIDNLEGKRGEACEKGRD